MKIPESYHKPFSLTLILVFIAVLSYHNFTLVAKISDTASELPLLKSFQEDNEFLDNEFCHHEMNETMVILRNKDKILYFVPKNHSWPNPGK